MSFLSNLWGGVKNTANAFVNDFKSGVSTINNALKSTGSSGLANAASAAPIQYTSPVNLSQTGGGLQYNSGPSVPGTTLVPDLSGNKYLYGNSTPQAQVQSLVSDYRPSTYTGQTTMGGATGSWTAPVDSYGRTSSETSGTPYFDSEGKFVVPSTGFGGVTGYGGSGFTTNPVSSTGTQGSGGSGARGFGSAAQGTTSNAYGTQPSDEEQRKQQQKNQGTQVLSEAEQRASGIMANVAPTLQNNQNKLDIPSVSDTIDAGWVQKATEAVSKLNAYGGQDKAQIINSLYQNLSQASIKLAQQEAAKGLQAEDTPEQKAFMDSLQSPEEKTAFQQAKDTWTAQNTNLNQLIKDRNVLKETVRTANELVLDQIKAVQDNPNLPKALARRQVDSLVAINKQTTQHFLDQIDGLSDQIDTQQRVVNQAFQIKEDAESQYNKAQDRIRQQIQYFMSNKVALAGLDENQIQQLALASGMPAKTWEKMRDTALQPDVVTNEFADGSIRGIDKNTGKTLWVIKGAAQPAGYSSTQAESGGVLEQLNASKNIGPEADGQYADPNLYAKLRSSAKMSASEFDNRFGYLVNPASKGRLGIGASASTSVTPLEQLPANQRSLVNDAKARIDKEKQIYGNVPAVRDAIINASKSQYGFDISPYI